MGNDRLLTIIIVMGAWLIFTGLFNLISRAVKYNEAKENAKKLYDLREEAIFKWGYKKFTDSDGRIYYSYSKEAFCKDCYPDINAETLNDQDKFESLSKQITTNLKNRISKNNELIARNNKLIEELKADMSEKEQELIEKAKLANMAQEGNEDTYE